MGHGAVVPPPPRLHLPADSECLGPGKPELRHGPSHGARHGHGQTPGPSLALRLAAWHWQALLAHSGTVSRRTEPVTGMAPVSLSVAWARRESRDGPGHSAHHESPGRSLIP